MCNLVICFKVYEVINFENNLSFLIKPFSCVHEQKNQDKIQISEELKELLRSDKKYFFICKRLALKQVKQKNPTFLEGESPTLRSTK